MTNTAPRPLDPAPDTAQLVQGGAARRNSRLLTGQSPVGVPQHVPPPRFIAPERVRQASLRTGPDANERQQVARARKVIDKWARLRRRPEKDTQVVWVRETTAALLRRKPTKEPTRSSGRDITGAVNLYLHRWAPLASEYRYLASLAREEIANPHQLSRSDQQRQREVFHRNDCRLVWAGAEGVFIDELRMGHYGDDVLDEWMRRKCHADLRLASALANRLNLPLLGVRVLPVQEPSAAVLVTARAAGLAAQALEAAVPSLVRTPARSGTLGRLLIDAGVPEPASAFVEQALA